MQTYNLIKDIDQLNRFIDILPELNQGESFYMSLFARKKYAPDIIKSNDKTQIKRVIINKKSDIISKIRQLETAIGSYMINDTPIPEEALVLYMHPNPRSQKKAAKLLLKNLVELITNDNSGYNVQAEALSALQKSPSRKLFVDFDFDFKTGNRDEEASELISSIVYILSDVNESYHIIVTRGGLHLLVKPNSNMLLPNDWYKRIQSLGCDVSGDCLTPIPGTTQGGFVPYII